MKKRSISTIPGLDINMAPCSKCASEAGVLHPGLVFLALLAAGLVG